MKDEEILKENNGKKFDICLMNPPYGDVSNGGMFIDMQFVEKCNKISNNLIVIHPANRWVSNTKIGKTNSENHHLESIDIEDGNKIFNISTGWKYAGIYKYNNIKEFDNVKVTFNNITNEIKYNDEYKRLLYYRNLEYPKNILEIINNSKSLYNQLLSKHNTMLNDTNSWIYEENRQQRGKRYGVTKKDQKSLERVKTYLKEGKYKYCLYKGSFNNAYDEVQEWKGQDPDKLFKGQICWLTNKENVKNNIKYWLECPLCDLWRRYYFGSGGPANCCRYGLIPALDFEMSEDEFKDYVDSLNIFTKEEIKILKDNNIHNADKL